MDDNRLVPSNMDFDRFPDHLVDSITVFPDSSIREVIDVLEKGGIQFAHVVLHDKLLGVISDGDVRRALLSGKTLDSPAEQCMTADFAFVIDDQTSAEKFSEFMRLGLNRLPVLRKDGTLDHLLIRSPKQFDSISYSNQVVIMAGGKGQRLRPLTEKLPKPLVEVGGEKLIDLVITRCVRNGFKNILISVNYLKELIIEHVGDGNKSGANVSYLEESEPLGTAGALGLIQPQPVEPFIVLNADVLHKVNLAELMRTHLQSRNIVTICARIYETQIPFGVISTEGSKVVGLEEKPILNHMINAGIYVVNPEVLELIKENEYLDMTTLIESVITGAHKVGIYPVDNDWLDVGSHASLAKARELGSLLND